jgi:phospholipid/cholesterol/gamma-HCH transport system substrate-binding protein
MRGVQVDERRQHVLTGAIAMVLVVALVTVGIKGAFGAFEGGYRLVGTFDAAGQGLLPGSDVKVRGVNIGEVRRIDLIDGAARITLTIKDGQEVPEGASATIRPKTLFGEKFVDIDPSVAPAGAPLLEDGGELTNTQGGFELEQVLAETYPLLKEIDPAELTTVLSELAAAGDGMGDEINRTLVNGAELSEVFADNAANTEQFLGDLALLSDELADQAETILEIADSANTALPTLNENEDDLVDLLQQAGRLSTDVADLLEANEPFVRSVMVDGSRTLQLLYDQRTQVIPLVVGLRQYVQTLSSVVRIEVGDGSLMAAVKGLLGTQVCDALPCAGGAATPPAAGESPVLPPIDIPIVDDVTGGLDDLLEKVLIG